MKRTKQCPKCQSLRVGHLEMQFDANAVVFGADHVDLDAATPYVQVRAGHQLAPRTVGRGIDTIKTGMLAYGDVQPMLGTLEAYVCVDCGFYESYVRDPGTVPWDRIAGFSWVNANPGEVGPYR